MLLAYTMQCESGKENVEIQCAFAPLEGYHWMGVSDRGQRSQKQANHTSTRLASIPNHLYAAVKSLVRRPMHC